MRFQWPDVLEQFNFVSMVFRLALTVVLSGALGMEREGKGRPAGFRTYLLVGIGAAVTMLIGQYEIEYFEAPMHMIFGNAAKLDMTRISAQVINGIGFLGAGTIIVTGENEVKGLTTAIGLWASACMGLAVGAGFYVGAVFAFLYIFGSFIFFPKIEDFFAYNSRSMNIYVEFENLSDLRLILETIQKRGIKVYEVDLLDKKETTSQMPAAEIYMELHQIYNHQFLLASLSEIETIIRIEEI